MAFAGAVLGLAGPAFAACGETQQATPRQAPTNPPPLAVGDSVLADTVQRLAAAGYEANGMICRTVDQGLAILRARGNSLPSLVVFALGTNGGITDTQVKEALAILGPSRRLVLVTPHHGDDPNSPQIVRAEVTRYAPQTVLLDWDRLSSPHPEWFASDGVHLGGSAGIQAYAQMIISALPYAQQSGVQAIPAPPPPPAAAPAAPKLHRTALTATRRGALVTARHIKLARPPLPAIVLPYKPLPRPGGIALWIIIAAACATGAIVLLAAGLGLRRYRRRRPGAAPPASVAPPAGAAPAQNPAPVAAPARNPAVVPAPAVIASPAATVMTRRRPRPPRKLMLGGAAMIALALAAARSGLDRGRR